MGKGKAEVGESVLFEKGPVGFRSFPILDGTWERADGQGEASPGGCLPPLTPPSARLSPVRVHTTQLRSPRPSTLFPRGTELPSRASNWFLVGGKGRKKKKPLVFL